MWFLVRYQISRCPNCQRILRIELDPTDGLRIGKEGQRCKCGQMLSTGRYEWEHLSAQEHRQYFHPVRTAIVLLSVPLLMSFTFARLTESQAIFNLNGLSTGLWFVLICYAISWAGKGLSIWLSLRRTGKLRT